MKPENKRKCMKCSTVIGAILLLMPSSVFWYWGNMSVYSMSYFVSVLDTTANVDTPWIISIFIVFWTFGTIASGCVADRLGRRATVLFGAIIADIAMFAGYFSNQHSVLLLTLTMGAVLGVGTGFIDGSALQLVMEWADDDVGTLTALIQASFAFGGVIINQVVTSYLNPDNLPTNVKVASLDYFGQKDVVDKVPYLYLVIGGFSFGVHVLGFSMLRRNPMANQPSTEGQPNDSETGYSSITKTTSDQQGDHLQSLHDVVNESRLKSQPSQVESVERKVGMKSKDFTPKGMLKEPSFYILWIAFFFGNMPFILLTNYYKVYGQLYIDDDHFLTNLGTTFTFINVFTNVLWGLGMDKFGVKNCLAVFMLTLINVTTWYFFTPMVNKWLFFVATLASGTLVGTIFSSFTAATVILYGKTHLSTNFGILMTSSLAFNIVAPFMLHSILVNLGWFAVYAIGAGGNIFSLILVLMFIPHV